MKATYSEEAIDAQVNWGSGEDPRKHLVVGETYETSYVEVHSSYTLLYFVGFEGLGFNSVCFDVDEDELQEYLDGYDDDDGLRHY